MRKRVRLDDPGMEGWRSWARERFVSDWRLCSDRTDAIRCACLRLCVPDAHRRRRRRKRPRRRYEPRTYEVVGSLEEPARTRHSPGEGEREASERVGVQEGGCAARGRAREMNGEWIAGESAFRVLNTKETH
ncbi:hypothetical protein FA13DRAFT_364471 [Coprinellus micaceus]|uniref:Uncharacterized protein n=1 Tax=Coprinellus micaceus TaxID=71717 RepID=A0A4Y7TB41_COPMI|nr:hypothetical protein FA13DRAFT_364471 [Coprinellus micaceus]